MTGRWQNADEKFAKKNCNFTDVVQIRKKVCQINDDLRRHPQSVVQSKPPRSIFILAGLCPHEAFFVVMMEDLIPVFSIYLFFRVYPSVNLPTGLKVHGVLETLEQSNF